MIGLGAMGNHIISVVGPRELPNGLFIGGIGRSPNSLSEKRDDARDLLFLAMTTALELLVTILEGYSGLEMILIG